MQQKGVANMARYASARFFTSGTHSEHRAARVRVRIAVVRDRTRVRLNLWHASVFGRRLERAFDCIFLEKKTKISKFGPARGLYTSST
jgi:aromatic ring-cleaving dioxygenase